MDTDNYSAGQRRAINLVWTACGDYSFSPQFLAMQADGSPDFYMNYDKLIVSCDKRLTFVLNGL